MKKLCFVIGDPISHSLSPTIHNAGFKALNLQGEYLYLSAQVRTEELSSAIKGFKAYKFRGLSCTIPHKEQIVDLLDKLDPTAKKIGAVNTVILEGEIAVGYNTDVIGIREPISRVMNVNGKNVVILGSGGSARTAAYTLKELGANIIVLARNEKNREDIAQSIGGIALGIDNKDAIASADVIINTTPVGLGGVKESPFSEKLINSRQLIFDLVYGKSLTYLLSLAENIGAKTIDGKEMLLEQAFAQFEIFTGLPAPKKEMRESIEIRR
jgi:shikimate dehydrogenase